MTPVEKYLVQIEAQVRLAREALAEEREGDLRTAVTRIELDAMDLGDMVRHW